MFDRLKTLVYGIGVILGIVLLPFGIAYAKLKETLTA